MKKLTYRYVVAILLLSVTAALSSILQYDDTQYDEINITNLQSIPMQIGHWQGKDIALNEAVYEILETKAIIHRVYFSNKNDNIFLSIVHYNDTKVDFHAPESCLGGLGLKTTKAYQELIVHPNGKEQIINVAKIISKNAFNDTLTYYFYKSGKFIGANYIKMRLNIAANKLFNNDTKGSLIRVSTNIKNGDEKKAENQLIQFIENIYPFINDKL